MMGTEEVNIPWTTARARDQPELEYRVGLLAGVPPAASSSLPSLARWVLSQLEGATFEDASHFFVCTLRASRAEGGECHCRHFLVQVVGCGAEEQGFDALQRAASTSHNCGGVTCALSKDVVQDHCVVSKHDKSKAASCPTTPSMSQRRKDR